MRCLRVSQAAGSRRQEPRVNSLRRRIEKLERKLQIGEVTLTMPNGPMRQIPIWRVFPMIDGAMGNRPVGDAMRAVIDSVSDNGVDVGMGHFCQVVRIIHGAKISTDAVIE
jgi:hypothetical protein